MSAREHAKNIYFFKPLGTILRVLSIYRFHRPHQHLLRNLLSSDWLKVYLARTQKLTGALSPVQAWRTITANSTLSYYH